jgi:hypothetical protein
LTATLASVFNEIHTPLYLFLFQYPQRAICGDRFSVGSILFLRTLYRRPALQHSLSPLRSFSDPRRSVPESSCAWGMRRSEPTLKPRSDQRSTEFLAGSSLERNHIARVAQCLSGTPRSEFFFGVARALWAAVNPQVLRGN